MRPHKAITVCIPTVSRPADLAVALASILGQTVRPHRVLVICDGPPEQAASIKANGLIENIRTALEAERIDVDFVTNPGPHGIGQAKNYYLGLVASEWFLQLEDDAWLSPDYIERLTLTPSFNRASTAGIAGIQLLPTLPQRAGWSDHDLSPQKTTPAIFNELRITRSHVEYLNKGQVYRYSPEALRGRKEFPAQCFLHTYMLRTQAVEQVGGWDLRFSDVFRSFAFEEVDATYNLWMGGYNLYVVPSAVMWHFRSDNRCLTWRYDAEKVREGYEHNERLFIQKWRGRKRNP
ncbi:MAG: glycosyltransferase [Elusimicrobiota bacterium]